LNVLHLAAGNRWTGAAAVAFAEVQALREAGVNAHFAYVGGYKLEQKLSAFEFAHPLIERRQHPLSFFRSFRAIRAFARRESIEIVHAHLTHDHWLARFLITDRIRAVRTFHSRRVLRNEPLTRSLIARTAGICVVNAAFGSSPIFRAKKARFSPPPVNEREFASSGADARALYGIGRETPLIMMIGKLSARRGFEEGLETFRLLAAELGEARMMIVGHGEHRPHLETLAASLGIAKRVIWAGYHEDNLANHYRAADVLLFTAAGSDEGHRAVLESLSCGTAVAAYPIAGVDALLGSLTTRMQAASPRPEALARTTLDLLGSSGPALRRAAAEQTRSFHYPASAERLVKLYAECLSAG